MHHANVLLRRARIAGVLERDPRMARLEQHGEHLAPQFLGLDALEQRQFAVASLSFVLQVAGLEVRTPAIVQVGHFVGGEQRPLAILENALHEQVWHPVGRVHVVGAATVVTGVLAQFQELLDVQVPRFQIGAHGALSFSALIHSYRRIVHHFRNGTTPWDLPLVPLM